MARPNIKGWGASFSHEGCGGKKGRISAYLLSNNYIYHIHQAEHIWVLFCLYIIKIKSLKNVYDIEQKSLEKVLRLTNRLYLNFYLMSFHWVLTLYQAWS